MQNQKNTGCPNLHKTEFDILRLYGGSIMEVELPKDFKDFLRLLNDERVDYLLIGGYAVGYYGYPRE